MTPGGKIICTKYAVISRMAMPTIQPTFTCAHAKAMTSLLFSSRKALFVATITWDHVIYKVLHVERDAKEYFAVSACKDDSVVSYLLCEYSMVYWHFLRHNGRINS